MPTASVGLHEQETTSSIPNEQIDHNVSHLDYTESELEMRSRVEGTSQGMVEERLPRTYNDYQLSGYHHAFQPGMSRGGCWYRGNTLFINYDQLWRWTTGTQHPGLSPL